MASEVLVSSHLLKIESLDKSAAFHKHFPKLKERKKTEKKNRKQNQSQTPPLHSCPLSHRAMALSILPAVTQPSPCPSALVSGSVVSLHCLGLPQIPATAP